MNKNIKYLHNNQIENSSFQSKEKKFQEAKEYIQTQKIKIEINLD